jgi:hypothetical protein
MREKPLPDPWATDEGRQMMADYLDVLATNRTALDTVMAAWDGALPMVRYYREINRYTGSKTDGYKRLQEVGIIRRTGKRGNVINRIGYKLELIDENVRNIITETVALLMRRTRADLEACEEFFDTLEEISREDLTES